MTLANQLKSIWFSRKHRTAQIHAIAMQIGSQMIEAFSAEFVEMVKVWSPGFPSVIIHI